MTEAGRTLSGRSLTAARAAGLTLAAGGLLAFLASLPDAYRRLVALDPYLVSNPAAVRAGLAELGAEPRAYALVWLAGLVVIATVFIGVGVLILLRRPHDRAALLFA